MSTYHFTSENYARPCVYVYETEGEVLYVGSSGKGFERAFNPRRSSTKDERRTQAHTLATRIRVYVFDTITEARNVEQDFIHRFRPRFNVAHNTGIKNANAPALRDNPAVDDYDIYRQNKLVV